MVLVPIGGGGLIGGVGTYLKELNLKVQVIGVEAEGSASMKGALSVGRPVELEAVDVFADGVAVKKVGKINFELAKKK